MPGLTDVQSSSLEVKTSNQLDCKQNGNKRLWGDLPHISMEIMGEKYP